MNGSLHTNLGTARNQDKEKKPFNWKPAAAIAGVAGLIGLGYWYFSRDNDKPAPAPVAVYEQSCIDRKVDTLTGEITIPHAPEDIIYRSTSTIGNRTSTITTENSVAAPRVVLKTGGKEYVLLTNAIFEKGDSAQILGKATAPGTFRANECVVNEGVTYGVRRSDALRLIGGDSARTLVGADSVIADYAVVDSVIRYKPKQQ